MVTRVYDAVVVGAGPAGSATAALLAERGFSVALLERSAFPRPKPCAEYLSPEDLQKNIDLLESQINTLKRILTGGHLRRFTMNRKPTGDRLG